MRQAQRWMLAGLAFGLGGFGLIALDQAVHGPLYHADLLVNDAVSAWKAAWPPLHGVGAGLTLIGEWTTGAAAVAVAAAWMLLRREWVLAAWCVGVGATSGIVVAFLKGLFERTRPEVGHLDGYSFPSGHTFGAAAVLGVCLVLAAETWIRGHPAGRRGTLHVWRWVLPAWAVLAALAALGRVLVQAHWVSDVLASLGLGLALVSGLLLALSRRSRGGDPGPTVPETPGAPKG